MRWLNNLLKRALIAAIEERESELGLQVAVNRITVGAKDVVVLSTTKPITMEQAARIRNMWIEKCPGIEAIVLDGTVKLTAIIGTDEADKVRTWFREAYSGPYPKAVA